MKKGLILFVFIVLIYSFQVLGQEKVIFFDDFEDGDLAGWQYCQPQDGIAENSTENPKNGLRSLKLYDNSRTAMGAFSGLSLDSSSSRIGVEFYEWTNDFGWNGGSGYCLETTSWNLNSGWGFMVGATTWTGGNWRYCTSQDKAVWTTTNPLQNLGADFTTPDAAQANSWHKIRIEISGPEGIVKAWFDDLYKGQVIVSPVYDPIKYFYHAISWSSPTTTINYLDDIRIYDLTETPNVNQPPVVNAGNNLTIDTTEFQQTVIQASASDPNPNDALQYRWKENATVVLDWTAVLQGGGCPLALKNYSMGIGTRTLTLEVTDGIATSSDSMLLTIVSLTPLTSQEILYSSNADGSNDVWLMNADGSNKVNISKRFHDPNGQYQETAGHWSADGSKIAFISNKSGFYNVWIMNTDGSNDYDLTQVNRSEEGPVFSPDGSKIYFSRNTQYADVPGCVSCPFWEIFVHDLENGTETQLTFNSCRDHTPIVSPDGKTIVFTRAERPNDCCNPTDIWMMNADGSNQRLFYGFGDWEYEWALSWGKQNNKILFYKMFDCGSGDCFEVAHISPDATNMVRVTNNSFYDSPFCFSPDGNKILFESTRSGRYQIWVMNANGSNPIQLTFDQTESWGADWRSCQVNGAPAADAGDDRPGVVGEDVHLDGRDSYDPDGDPLSFRWTIDSRPEGSNVQLNDATVADPFFTPDVAGLYMVRLVVNDGRLNSEPDRMIITVSPLQDSKPDLTLASPDITFSNQNPQKGERTTITATIHNLGDAPAENVRVRFFDQEEMIGEGLIGSIRPGLSMTNSIQWAGDREDFHLIRVIVHQGNLIDELREDNNEATRSVLVGNFTGSGSIIVTGGLAPVATRPGFTVLVSGDATYDTTFSSGDPVAGADVKIKVAGGAGYQTHTIANGRYEYKINAPFQPGEYIIYITVTDFTFSKTIEILLQVDEPLGIDLLPDHITFSNNQPVAGDVINISADIHNIGQLEAQDVLVRIYDGGTLIGEQTIASLPGGSFQTIYLTWTALAAGSHRIYVIADPDNLLVEDNEQNNQKYEDLYVFPAQPDVTPIDIHFSTDRPLVNQRININTLIKNIGGSAAGDIGVRIYDGQEEIGRQTILHLSGKGSTASLNFSYLAGTAGWHAIKVVADPDNVITEADETNNEYIVMLYVHAPGPDLSVFTEDIAFSNDRPIVGDTITISLNIHNIGEMGATNVAVRIWDGSQEIGNRIIPAIGPGCSETLQLLWTASPVGCHWLRVTVDPDNQIEESYENNNTATRRIYVYPLPGESVSDLLVYSEDIVFSNTNPEPGEVVKIYAAIHNVGEREARNIPVDFYVDDTKIGTQIVSLMGNNDEEIVMAPWAAILMGSHVVKVIIDPLYCIVESDKDNNTASRAIIVGGLADLAVSGGDLDFSKTDPRAGEVITISANIHNIGQSQASFIWVGFFDGDPACSGTQIGSPQLIPILPVGESCKVQVQWSTEGQAGNHQIYVLVDPTGAIAEENKANNQAYKNLAVQNSNHPPLVNAGENITIRTIDKPMTVIIGTAADEDPGDYLQYRWREVETILLDWTMVGPNGECLLNLATTSLTIGTHTLTLDVTDGKATVSDEMILTIENTAPHAAPMGGGVYEINSTVTLGGNVSDYDGDSLTYKWLEGEAVLFDGAVQTPAGGEPVGLPNQTKSTLCLGIHTMTLQVTDGINAPVSSSISVQIVDTTVPTLAPVANQTILWPPNHKLVDITIQTNAADNSGVVTVAATIASNEPVDGLGDGDTAPDWTQPIINQQTGIITFQLRAERSGSGNGRVYTVTINATDNSNNTSTAKMEIIVPHDKKK